MKKMISLAIALLIGASGAVHAQKQEAAKPAAAPATKSAKRVPRQSSRRVLTMARMT